MKTIVLQSEAIRATRHHAPMYGNIPFKNVSKTTLIMLHSYTILTFVTSFIYVRYLLVMAKQGTL